MRIVRRLGNVSVILPDDVPLADAPYTLTEAISQGLYFLQIEELPEDRQPPKKIWLDPERMNAWFDRLKQEDEAKAKGDTPGGAMAENKAAEEILFGE